MKSFLGLISQFRDHVQNYADLTAPCHDMILGYKKGSKVPLEWNDELNDNFIKLKAAVANCSKLYFIDDKLPIFLHTDASILGIGSYLFQLKDDERIPIRFISLLVTSFFLQVARPCRSSNGNSGQRLRSQASVGL